MANQKLIYDILKGKNTLSPELNKSKKDSKSLTSSVLKLGKSFGGVVLKAGAAAAALGSAAAAFVTVKAVRESIQLENALIGLKTVAAGTGNSVDQITAAAKQLSADGLIPLADASASLKNLLASGLDADQAVKTFKVLRDSAAFGRQGALDLGEAIRGASEGIKNGNSILVDNAGITKNLSVLQKEYAASLGTTVGALDEAQKIQAIYVGLQKEGALFTGDYVKLQKTFSGSLSSVGGSFKFLLGEIGDFITQSPVAIALVSSIGKAFKSFKDVLVNNRKSIQAFVNSLIKGFVGALPIAVEFFQKIAGAASYVTGVVLKLAFAFNGLAQSIAEIGFVQGIFRLFAQGIALATTSLLEFFQFLGGTKLGKGFLEDILGLDSEKIDAQLEKTKESLFKFADEVTGDELASKLGERGTWLAQLIGANEEGAEKLNAFLESSKENLKVAAGEILSIEKDRIDKAGKQETKADAKNTKEKKKTYLGWKDIFQDYAVFEEQVNKNRGQNFKSTLGTISTLTQQSNSTLFNIGKAAAISTAIVDGYAGVMKAWALGPIVGPPLAALVATATAANIAKISSAKPPAKKQEGGFVEGVTSSGDRTSILANSGELFLNRQQQAELFNIAKGRDTGSVGGQENKIIDLKVELEGREIARVIRDLQVDGYLAS